MKVHRAMKDYYYENFREIHTEINLNNLIFKVNTPKGLKKDSIPAQTVWNSFHCRNSINTESTEEVIEFFYDFVLPYNSPYSV